MPTASSLKLDIHVRLVHAFSISASTVSNYLFFPLPQEKWYWLYAFKLLLHNFHPTFHALSLIGLIF